MKSRQSIEDEMYEQAARLIAEQIDKELIEGMQAEHLLKQGWTKSPVDCQPLSAEQIANTAAWAHLNATGDYKLLNSNWYFERAKDATMFTLVFAHDE